MPEIWLNYGTTEVVLEIKVENLEQAIGTGKIVNYGRQDDGAGAGRAGAAPDGDASGGNGESIAGNGDAGGDDGRSGADGGSGMPGGDDSGNSDRGSDDASDSGSGNGSADADTTTTTLNPGNDVANVADAAPSRTSRTMGTLDYLEPQDVSERLGALDLSRPFDLVIMHDSQAVRQVVSSLFMLCEQRTAPFPGILADRDILSSVKAGLPEGSIANAFEAKSMPMASDSGGAALAGGTAAADPASVAPASGDARNLVFVAETEFDGLFGYETVSTRLIRRFGGSTDYMLSAYAKREGNTPAPGRRAGSFAEARKFADGFEIQAIDIVAGAGGIADMFVGHPSETAVTSSSSLETSCVLDVDHQKTLIVSTGKPSSSATLGDALSSVWNCQTAVRGNGLLVLVAECSRGLGPAALRMHVEGRLPHERLSNPSAYVDGMEELLFLHEIKQRCQMALVSVLPEMYTNKLGMISIEGMLQTVRYMQNTQGARQKASVVMDGSRLLLR